MDTEICKNNDTLYSYYLFILEIPWKNHETNICIINIFSNEEMNELS